jgi:hypothetical protein
VFLQVSDPVGSGFVGSLAHPGGNIFSITCGKEIIDLEIATYSPSKLLQALLQRDGTILCLIRSPHQHNSAAPPDVLRKPRVRPCDRRHTAKI